MHELRSAIVPALAGVLLDFLWQGALIGLLAWLASALLRNARPQARYAVACLALLACAVLPLVRFALALGPADEAPGGDAIASAFAAGGGVSAGALAGRLPLALPGTPQVPLAWVVALWATGAALLSLRMLGGALWLHRLCRDARIEAGHWQARVDALAGRLDVRRPVALRLVADGDGPATAGWWRPVILLPAAVALRLPGDLLEALLAHELAHVRRHDYLVNLLQRLVETLLFYHPVVWWLSHRIRVERELVADALAADALGDGRRLAIALAELDRLAAASRSPFPLPSLAQAAHGGHLMSRIQRLVRPARHAVGAAVIPPLLGLAVAAGAFYAHARRAPSPVAPVASVAPVAGAAATPSVAATPPAPAAAPQVAFGEDRAGYALVRKGEDGMMMSGSGEDIDAVKAARRAIDGDFLWFHRDGKAYVIRDADTLARAEAAWSATRDLNAQMATLNARMQPHQDKMQALSERMQALQTDVAEPPEMQAASAEMHRLGAQMGTLSTRQAALGARMAGAGEAEQAALQEEMDALSAEQERLGRDMERQGEIMEAAGKRIEARTAPMEAIGAEMEAAAAPMEAIGKEMEALGKRLERSAKQADERVRRLIDEAYARGLASPAPGRQ